MNTGTLSPNAFLAAPPEAAWSAPPSASAVVLKMALFERPRLGTVAPSGRSSEAYGMGMSNGKWESDISSDYSVFTTARFTCEMRCRFPTKFLGASNTLIT